MLGLLENRPPAGDQPGESARGDTAVPPLKSCKVCGCPVGMSAIKAEPLCVYCFAWAVKVTAMHVALQLMVGWSE